jgi:hypothetical protein
MQKNKLMIKYYEAGHNITITEGRAVMTMRRIAFWVGLFSLVVGLITYDSTVVTAPVPVVTGMLVIVLAVFDLIPELTKECVACGRKIARNSTRCPHCGARQQADVGDKKPS